MTTIATVLSAVTQGLYFCSKPGILTYVSKSSYHRMIFVVVFLTTTKKMEWYYGTNGTKNGTNIKTLSVTTIIKHL